MTAAQTALCNGNFTDIHTYLSTLQNTRLPGDSLEHLRIVAFVTAYRTAYLKNQIVQAALPDDVCPFHSFVFAFRGCR
jgi:hypothetical protein